MTRDDTSMLRIPPHAIEAEQSVLGGLMLDSKSLAKISDWLTEDAFYRADHRLLYRAILHLERKGEPVDPVTMGDWLAAQGLSERVGGLGYIVEIANTTPSAANVVAYAEIVAEKARLRNAITVGTELASAAFDGKAPSEQLIGEATQRLSELQTASARRGLAPVKGVMKRLFQEMVRRYESGPQLLGLPTPWHELNTVTKGLRPGLVYVLAGRTSMGKTIIGGQVATFTALRGKRVALFSVEMTEDEQMTRAIAAHADVPHDWVEQPNNADEDSELYWQRMTNVMAELTQSPILLDDTPDLRIEQLIARAKREHMRKPIDLIVIDHLHDMGTDRKAELRHELGRITQGVKTLAKELNCPALLLAQLNRGAATRADKRPNLTDLRESGEIEQKADVILFVHREDYYDANTHLKGVVEIIPAKGRNIRIGKTVHLANRYDRMRADDWEGALPLPPIEEAKPRGFRGFGKRRPVEGND